MCVHASERHIPPRFSGEINPFFSPCFFFYTTSENMLVLDTAYVFNRFCHSPLLSVTQVLTDTGTCATKKRQKYEERKENQTNRGIV